MPNWANIQNDLFDLGFDPGLPDGDPGLRTRAALAAFEAVARTPYRVHACAVIHVPLCMQFDGVGNEIHKWKDHKWTHVPEYEQQRVRVKRYGRIAQKRLVHTPGIGKLHPIARDRLVLLQRAAWDEVGLELRIRSAWRDHRWTSRDHYESWLVRRYGSVSEGRKWLAYRSPHETGLAVDFGSEGLEPNRRTRKAQRKTKAHKWLRANAFRFGWRPYKREPWHWECPISERKFHGE